MATLPAQAVTGQLSPRVLAAILFAAASTLFHFSLRRYDSASS